MIAELIILVMGIPIGYLIAWLARDELVSGRVWFYVLIFASIFLGGFFIFYKEFYIVWTCGFVIIASVIGIWKGKDDVWTKKKI